MKALSFLLACTGGMLGLAAPVLSQDAPLRAPSAQFASLDPVAAPVIAPAGGALADVQAPLAWTAWLDSLRADALLQGISEATLAQALGGLEPSARVVALDRAQPEVKASYRTYLERRLTEGKKAEARARAAEVQPLLAEIEASYGVPGRIVMGIWGMETHFGRLTGDFDVVRALASLAYDGRRADLFRTELLAALKLLDAGHVERAAFRGSWAGAVGQGQFLPSSVLAYGVDKDGDGRVDVWNSRADALASIANYLRAKGWSEPGQGWGMAVAVPSALDRAAVAPEAPPTRCKPALSRHSRALPVAQWKALGLFNASAGDWPADDVTATLVEPDGPGGPAYLVTGNYHALLAYNCSNFYALSVALLADSLI